MAAVDTAGHHANCHRALNKKVRCNGSSYSDAGSGTVVSRRPVVPTLVSNYWEWVVQPGSLSFMRFWGLFVSKEMSNNALVSEQ